MTSNEMQSAALSDGRHLAYLEYGARSGTPVFFFHGSPGSRLPLVPAQQDVAAEIGVRLICVERPGFGESTRLQGRTLLGWADDVDELADALELDRFSVIGFSGGGPFALVCAAALTHRLRRAVAVGCGAPWDVDELAGDMDFQRRALRFLSQRAPWLIGLTLKTLPHPRRQPERLVRTMLSGLPAPDQAILEREEFFELAVEFNSAGVIHGFDGMVDELGILARPWGFELDSIDVPVILWQGSEDTAAPMTQAVYLANTIPGAELRLITGEGHLCIVDHFGEILRSACD